jgi:hypothetical protein
MGPLQHIAWLPRTTGTAYLTQAGPVSPDSIKWKVSRGVEELFVEQLHHEVMRFLAAHQ